MFGIQDINRDVTDEKAPIRCWFQSPEAAEIWAHMSQAEREQYQRRVMWGAGIYGAVSSLVSLIVSRRLWPHLTNGDSFGWHALQVGFFTGIVALLLAPFLIRAYKSALASSAYAKSKGMTRKDIPLYSFRRTRA
jgi:hypothetical protein